MLGENIIELVTPSSGNRKYYRIFDEALALSDSVGALDDSELAEHYVLRK